ncbi:MAG TPA: ABC transporter substrate-binding protein [Kofleriaceae bacterium]
MKAALVLLLVACGEPDRDPRFAAGTSTEPHDGGTLHVALKDEVRTLDPAVGADDDTMIVLHTLFDTLVDYEPTSLALRPRLARSWTVSPDGLVYAFTLRDDIRYANGAPIVAADFAYALERARTLPTSPFGGLLEDVADVAAPDPLTLRITLARPYTALPFVLAMPFTAPLPRAYVDATGPAIRHLPLASGPYVVERWVEGQEIVLRKNPSYFDRTRGHVARIDMLENLASDAAYLMFLRGDLDVVDRLSVADQTELASRPAWAPYLHAIPMMNAFGSRMNVTVPPFTDRRVRQALNYALDKSHTARLFGGATIPSHGLLVPGMAGRDDALPPYPHDVAKAKQLLAEAGYPDGLDLEYVTAADDEYQLVAASLQSDLAEAGVRVHITTVSWATYLTAVARADGPAFSYTSWAADFPDPADFFDTRFSTRGIAASASNDSFYSNPVLDGILDTARGEPDPVKRAALYQWAERILYVDAPWVWDYHRLFTEVTQPYVRGYQPHPIWLRDYTSIWLDPKVRL